LLTLNILEDFLLHFKGCLVVVSHDRYFMDKIVDHLFIFEGQGKIRDFNGTYSDYRMEEEEKAKTIAVRPAKPDEENKTVQPAKKKLTYKEKLEFEKLEKEIQELEEEKNKLTEKLSNENLGHAEANELALRMQQIIEMIDSKSMRWLELSELSQS
jgi:ATP-binding cassette subfamily F protein uup